MSLSAVILGASRGLGHSISRLVSEESVLISRTQNVKVDLSKPESLKLIKSIVDESNVDCIIYCVGGGPHGDFFTKPFHSHRWAYEVNFFRPIELASYLKSRKYKGLFVYIGSAIAERSSSLKSLSYSDSKKMSLKTLMSIDESDLRVRVFSPPYMDTGLLPKNSWPRIEHPELVLDPDEVAKTLKDWISGDFKQSGTSDPRHFDWIDRFSYSLPNGKEF